MGIAGTCGSGSLLQEFWPAGPDGTVAEDAFAAGSRGAVWIDGERIARLEVLVEGDRSTS